LILDQELHLLVEQLNLHLILIQEYLWGQIE
jgi:hypothetical protein